MQLKELHQKYKKENVQLPYEEGSQRCMRKYFMCLLHGHRPPVVTAVLELLIGVFHQIILFFAAEWTKVGGQAVNISSSYRLQQKRRHR